MEAVKFKLQKTYGFRTTSPIFVRLIIENNKDRSRYRLFPLINKSICWSEVKDIEVVKISAISDFLGWGIRFSKKFGWSYITNSEYGLFIRKNNGKKITLSIKN